ncbi:tRNA lysidine(34) synthetase TilS [Candidatus Saccharibacteria bacterium]|nr:tRNA lysidine(34) synthetase TilS [Candidatus Saccharibacteria bacterium]
MSKVLAISGGVDSMLMMQILPEFEDCVVAHFNHGTRPSADADEAFVRAWAEQLGLPFYCGRAELGENVSEAVAREKRYAFLNEVTEEVGGVLVTAHHLNDLAETVAINFLRGTGWRGLAPFSNEQVLRFYIDNGKTKKDVLKMAAERGVVFRQDPTNTQDNYLRNRVREKTAELSETCLAEIHQLYVAQNKLRGEIDGLVQAVIEGLETVGDGDGKKYWRKWFFDGGLLGGAENEAVALEILRAGLIRAGVSATRPQILDFLTAVRTYAPSKKFNLPGGKMVTLYKDYFVL